VVRRMVPFMPLLSFPTAVHVLASVQETALFTLLDCWIHVAPPSVVRRIPHPTAVQVLASVQETAEKIGRWPAGLLCPSGPAVRGSHDDCSAVRADPPFSHCRTRNGVDAGDALEPPGPHYFEGPYPSGPLVGSPQDNGRAVCTRTAGANHRARIGVGAGDIGKAPPRSAVLLNPRGPSVRGA
jgi:hypothetical protein